MAADVRILTDLHFWHIWKGYIPNYTLTPIPPAKTQEAPLVAGTAMCLQSVSNVKLGGDFKKFLFSSLFGEDFPFD